MVGLLSIVTSCSRDARPSPDSGQQAMPARETPTVSDGAVASPEPTPKVVDAGSVEVAEAGMERPPSSDPSLPTPPTEAKPRASPPPLAAPSMSEPENLGPFVGPSVSADDAARIYGSNLGVTFEHGDALFMLLGDTWADRDSACTSDAADDDVVASLSRAAATEVPALDGVRHLQLFRDGAAQNLGPGRAPIAGFSDGARAYALFARHTTDACGDSPSVCASDMPRRIELAAARSGDAATYDVAFSWQTSKFAQPALRTLAKFTGEFSGSDYRPGHDTLLIWGRPALVAEHGRQAPLYLMRHRLPLSLDASGMLKFAPQYFSGLDAASGQPLWADAESSARPIALDGRESGDPHELLQITGRMAVAWAPAPIDKWVMLYGGELADAALLDPTSTRSKRSPGAIMLRFADHPWGPFSAPVPHLAPGSAQRAGGFLYAPECVAAEGLRCAAPNPSCSAGRQPRGWLYGPNIIDRYTTQNAEGGIDLWWNVSTSNPYGIQLLRTKLKPAAAPQAGDPLADDRGLERLREWKTLPTLGERSRYRQQSSHDRGTEGDGFALSRAGNRDYNNFICASRDATIAAFQFSPMKFDRASCEESYVRGAVMARFVGAGRHVRSWFGMGSLLNGPDVEQVLRIYVDDEATPRIEARLSEVLDGRAGEAFAPPFGAGSPRRLAWYYPIRFERKFIAALDNLGNDDHFFHWDVMLDEQAKDTSAEVAPYPSRRAAAAAQLSAVYSPAGTLSPLRETEMLRLAAKETRSLRLQGPATLHELRVRLPDGDFARLGSLRIRARWDADSTDAIDVSLAELLGNGDRPPERSAPALTSHLENGNRVLALQLPMPFASSAEFTFENVSESEIVFELALLGTHKVPEQTFGHLHVQRRETLGPTQALRHIAAEATGLGRLVGVCAHLQAQPDPDAGIARAGLNALEADVRAQIDGQSALEGTGTEEYADDVYYFLDAPQASPFVQAWGVANPTDGSPGLASLCRWHVLGTELDYSSALELSFELGGSKNPGIVQRLRTVAYLYQ